MYPLPCTAVLSVMSGHRPPHLYNAASEHVLSLADQADIYLFAPRPKRHEAAFAEPHEGRTASRRRTACGAEFGHLARPFL